MASYNPTTQRFEGPGSMYPAGSSGPSNTGFIGDTPYGTFSPMDDPKFAELLQMILSGIPQAGGGLQDFITQGINSPLLQAILGPALAQLIPGERQARTALTDRFRAAGGLRDTAYGTAATGLEGEILGKRGALTGQLTAAMLGPIMQMLMEEKRQKFQGPELMAKLLSSLKPEIVPGRIFDPRGVEGAGSGRARPFNISDTIERLLGDVRGSKYDPWNVRDSRPSVYQNPPASPFDYAAYERYFIDQQRLPGAGGGGGGGITYGPWSDVGDEWGSGLEWL